MKTDKSRLDSKKLVKFKDFLKTSILLGIVTTMGITRADLINVGDKERYTLNPNVNLDWHNPNVDPGNSPLQIPMTAGLYELVFTDEVDGMKAWNAWPDAGLPFWVGNMWIFSSYDGSTLLSVPVVGSGETQKDAFIDYAIPSPLTFEFDVPTEQTGLAVVADYDTNNEGGLTFWIAKIGDYDFLGPEAGAFDRIYDCRATSFKIAGIISDEYTGGSRIAYSEYIIDDWESWSPMMPTDGVWDGVEEWVFAEHDSYGGLGVKEVKIRGIDAAGNTGEESVPAVLAFYDSENDSIACARRMDFDEGDFTLNPSLEGMLRFGFACEWDSKKYGNQEPVALQFVLSFEHLDFQVHHDSVKMRVYYYNNRRKGVKLKGTGTLAGLVDCKFMVEVDIQNTWIKLWTEGRDGEEKIIIDRSCRYLGNLIMISIDREN